MFSRYWKIKSSKILKSDSFRALVVLLVEGVDEEPEVDVQAEDGHEGEARIRNDGEVSGECCCRRKVNKDFICKIVMFISKII